MKNIVWGFAAPALGTLVVIATVILLPLLPSIQHGILYGIAIAWGQTFITVGAMRWALETKFFYWVWGGGILFRFLVFFATAFFVYRTGQVNLVATMLSMVGVTTILLVIESMVLLTPVQRISRAEINFKHNRTEAHTG